MKKVECMYKGDEGFFKFIVAFIILIAVFAYFDIDFRALVENYPQFFTFFHDLWEFVVNVWVEYILPLLEWIWNKISFK